MKRIKHYHEPGHAHLLTFSCYHRMPLLTNDLWNKWLSRGIDNAVNARGFQLIVFVFMPDHVHLMVYPGIGRYDIGPFLKAIKRPFSFRVKKHLQECESPLQQRLTVHERPGRNVFRFWQKGPGRDRNFVSHEAALKAADYVHNNPVRKGLWASPEEWLWSSWKHYHRPREPVDPRLPKVHGFPGV